MVGDPTPNDTINNLQQISVLKSYWDQTLFICILFRQELHREPRTYTSNEEQLFDKTMETFNDQKHEGTARQIVACYIKAIVQTYDWSQPVGSPLLLTWSAISSRSTSCVTRSFRFHFFSWWWTWWVLCQQWFAAHHKRGPCTSTQVQQAKKQ